MFKLCYNHNMFMTINYFRVLSIWTESVDATLITRNFPLIFKLNTYHYFKQQFTDISPKVCRPTGYINHLGSPRP